MTNRRHLLALGLLVLTGLLAGCFGPSEIPDEELNENATYDWDTDADVTFNLSRSSYTAVANVTNRSTLEVWQRSSIEGDSPVRLRALKFRYRNGTVVTANGSSLAAPTSTDRTTIQLPARNGTVAYTAPRSGKSFGTPAFVDGSYEIVLEQRARIGVPLLSQASPGGWETSIESGRMVVRWDAVSEGTISVRYYLQRDLLLFTGLVALVVVVGIGGSVYYLRQIRRLEARREQVGPDVEYEEDDLGDDGPPPGMG